MKVKTPDFTLQQFLKSLGWNDFFQKSFDEINSDADLVPGRIISQEKIHYHVQIGPNVVVEAAITGRFRHIAKHAIDFPAVGDWVSCIYEQAHGQQKINIHSVLTRKNLIQRKRAGHEDVSQLIAANVDFMLIATSLNEDFDLPRIGRYLAVARESGTSPVLLLTKVDLCKNSLEFIDAIKNEFDKVVVLAISNRDPASLEQIQPFFASGNTCVLLGSSGVGKSTLTNFLLGINLQKTQDLSSESKGRHTTTARNLLVTRWGGLVIDTPGMKDISVLAPEEELQKNFSDIEELTVQCKFSDCRHKSEPGCAISGAIKSGKLEAERWSDYLELQSEVNRAQKKRENKGKGRKENQSRNKR